MRNTRILTQKPFKGNWKTLQVCLWVTLSTSIMIFTFALFLGLGFARINAGNSITFTFSVQATAKYFMLLRYSLYQIDFYSSILPQGREKIDWLGSSNKFLYLKNNDDLNEWVFDINILNNKGDQVKSYEFGIKDLDLGNDRVYTGLQNLDLATDVVYTFTLRYRETALQFGDPWPLLLDSVIFMLDYKSSTYYMVATEDHKNEISTCFEHSKSLATTYNLPQSCGVHIFTIDLQIFQKALGS